MKSNRILYHKSILEKIDNLNKPKQGRFEKRTSALHDIKATLKANKDTFAITIDKAPPVLEKRLENGQTFRKTTFISNDEAIVQESLSIDSQSLSNFEGTVGFMYSKGYSKSRNYYYRLIIPLKKKLCFRYNIERHIFSTDLGYRYNTGTKAKVDGDSLLISVICDEKKRYFLSIESNIKQPFFLFSKKTFAIKIALGYLSGYLAGDQGYYFAYTKMKMEDYSHFYVCQMRKSLICRRIPVHTNPFRHLYKNKKLAQSYYDKKTLKLVPTNVFSNLCQNLKDSVEFSSTLLLIVESDIASLLFMPGGYAIALETVSDLILDKKKLKLSPIKDKKISKKVRAGCKESILTYCSDLPEGDLNTLLGRIDHINQVTNKARLKAPFKLLDINLSLEDESVLNSRNDFLHGRTGDFKKIGTNRTIERLDRDSFYAGMRFYTLLSVLILKWVGYDNYVINYPKIHEGFTKIRLKEKAYRKV